MILLRRELVEIYDDLKDKEEITRAEFREMEDTYNCYHELGGNGLGTHMYDDIMKKDIVL